MGITQNPHVPGHIQLVQEQTDPAWMFGHQSMPLTVLAHPTGMASADVRYPLWSPFPSRSACDPRATPNQSMRRPAHGDL
jgi:hypothetical protein